MGNPDYPKKIRNLPNDWNPDHPSTTTDKDRNPVAESTAWTPESKTVLDSLTWGAQNDLDLNMIILKSESSDNAILEL